MSEVHSDLPWWLGRIRKEPNMARLQAAVCRGEFVLDEDEIIKLGKVDKPRDDRDKKK